MRVVTNRFLPLGKRCDAINIFGVVFVKGSCDAQLLRHEYIHTLQMRETAFVGFYLWYLIEWLVRLLCCLRPYKAYRNISFEREAYARQSDAGYPAVRRRYALRR